jgi:M6 family metalloprotease-like protein
LLVDFDDEPGTIPPSEFEDYCNQIGYNGYGDRGSVRDYFYDVSDGHLTYTNFVPTSYYRASQLMSWYEDPAYPCCDRTIQLVQEALFDLDSQGFDFSEYDSNGDGVIDAVNVFYAGIGSCPWPCGLTAHAWWVSFSADGVSTYWYQITPIWNALYLSVFCHENGHILCYWPDLYDHGHDSYGVGIWSLMGWLSSRTSPSEPDAYLKSVAGWADATLLTTPQVGLPVPADDNVFYKFEHPSAANEYFLIENRHHSSWDSSLPDSGLAIWHVDELGNNDWEQMTPEYHYRVSLEQADGNLDLEYMINGGDDSDLWASPDYPQCTPDTYPNTNWWDGSASGLYITDISTSSPTMTFDFGHGAPTEVPAISEWGLVAMVMLVLSAGTVVLRRSHYERVTGIMSKTSMIGIIASAVLALATTARADVEMAWVVVGDPGNVADTRYDPTGLGGVVYEYRIGKYEVTNAQYAEFLSAVAAVGDPNGLYNTDMGGGWNGIGGISRTGSGTGANPWLYAARPNRGNRPVNYVSWYDTVRFANWMHNGQPGLPPGDPTPQDENSTEDGAYDMSVGPTVGRKPGALVFLPSEDEWYKAAYYRGGGTSAGYWDYPTESNTAPTAETPPGTDLANGSANYADGGHVDSTYYTTVVGAYTTENPPETYVSDGPYGTFDQAGNIWERTETDREGDGSHRCLRGGLFDADESLMRAATPMGGPSTSEFYGIGFRVAGVYEQDPVCGDGRIEEGEECDDNSTDEGDGCSSTCTVEDGWECTGEPSTCVLTVPTVSEWGLVAMVMLVLSAGTVVLRRSHFGRVTRIMSRTSMIRVIASAVLALATTARADVEMAWVVVGDPGNTGEVSGAGAGGSGPTRICGTVDYEYRIGKYEVTNEQYIEFLNAVASVEDTHELFEAEDPAGHGGMDGQYGGVQQTGSPGDYTYVIKDGDTEWIDRPIHFIDFYDTLRFANWMHNGQPTGLQDESTTEDGAYDMSLSSNVVRKAGARVFLPNEDEWYKAAYYKGGGTNAGYWNYCMDSDWPPVAEPPPGSPAPPGSANYNVAVGAPYWASDAGAYVPSFSPYGTFDQCANVHEWTDTWEESIGPFLRGSGWGSSNDPGHAANHFGGPPEGQVYLHTGFRIAALLEPDPVPAVSHWGMVVATRFNPRLEGATMATRNSWILVVVAVAFGVGSAAWADVEIEWVVVGDPGNAADTRYETPGYGGVAYAYNIGKYEVTNTQYCEFLNAVAEDDPNGLYNPEMGGGWNDIGGITRSGIPGSHTYSVRENRDNRPVNYVSFYDALRFANWMHNGQPTGSQDASTTENGAYDMSLGSSVYRKLGARVFLPREIEWYKAAYYKGGGVNAGYWDYATQSDTASRAEAPPGTDMTHGSANWYDGGYVDTAYYTTEVGAYDAKPSESACGTFDQGGNVWEWNEADIYGDGSHRGMRGGAFYGIFVDNQHAAYRQSADPTYVEQGFGFRVAGIPEPEPLPAVSEWGLVVMALGLLAVGTVVFARREAGHSLSRSSGGRESFP